MKQLNSVYLVLCVFLLTTQACKKSTTETGTSASELTVSPVSSNSPAPTTCLSADDVTKEMAAGTSNVGTLQLKQLYTPQVFVDNINYLSVYVDYNTLGADASGSTPPGVDMTPTFMIWKACAFNNSSSCTNNGNWTSNYNFTADNIIDMPLTLNKVSVKICVPNLKFLSPEDQTNAVNSCAENAPCYCGAEANMTYDNSKGVLLSSKIQAQIDAVKQARSKMYAIAENYVNAATNYVTQCSTQDASSTQSAAKIGLQYAQNISALSPSDVAYDSEQMASQRLAYIQALSSANQGMKLASTTEPNAMCTAANTEASSVTTSSALGLADSSSSSSGSGSSGKPPLTMIGLGIAGVGLAALLGAVSFGFYQNSKDKKLGKNTIEGTNPSTLKRMMLYENERFVEAMDAYLKGMDPKGKPMSAKAKQKLLRRMAESADRAGQILQEFQKAAQPGSDMEKAITRYRGSSQWEAMYEFLDNQNGEIKRSISEAYNAPQGEEGLAKRCDAVFEENFVNRLGKVEHVDIKSLRSEVRNAFSRLKNSDSIKGKGFFAEEGKGKAGAAIAGIIGVVAMIAGGSVAVMGLDVSTSCGNFLATASTYEGQLLSQQSAIQNAQAILNP